MGYLWRSLVRGLANHAYEELPNRDDPQSDVGMSILMSTLTWQHPYTNIRVFRGHHIYLYICMYNIYIYIHTYTYIYYIYICVLQQ